MPSKDHPLLFTSEMVRAILEDRKTQTRRVPIERYRNWKVGEMIWAREAWWDLGFWKDEKWHGRTMYHTVKPQYCADGEPEGVVAQNKRLTLKCQWRKRPSIHMPKWAARIWLEITGLRVEKVQDIGESGAVAEGVEHYETAGLKGWKPYKYFTKNTVEYKARRASTVCKTARDSFISLWDSLNAKRGYRWDKNPEVKVIEFKRIQDYP